jgi:hypothetical protein
MAPPRRGNPSGGEQVDRAVADSVRLAHRALERFPELVRRHKFIAGGAAISSSLIVLAGVAIARRMLAGETPEEAVAAVTEEEVQGVRPPEPENDGELAPASEDAAPPTADAATASTVEPTPIHAGARASTPMTNGHTAPSGTLPGSAGVGGSAGSDRGV